MRDDPTPVVTGSTAGALTHVHTLADVRRPEDLPPEVAEEIAELLATRRYTIGRWLKDGLPSNLAAAAAFVAFHYVSSWFFFPGVYFAIRGLSRAWTEQLYGVLDERLRELGLSRRARVAIRHRVVELLGPQPRTDPAERPRAARLLEHLAPQRDRLGGRVAAPVMSAVEREHDDVRMAALAYLRTSRITALGGWLGGAMLVAMGGVWIGTGNPVELAGGTMVVGAGIGLLAASSVRSFGDTRRAIPHAPLRFGPAWRLWRRIRSAAKRTDKGLPDTERAKLIASAVVGDA